MGYSTSACFNVIDGAQSPAQEHSAGTNPGLSELQLPATAIAPAGGVLRHAHSEHPKGEREIATDYDTPRKTDDDLTEDSIEELKARTRSDKTSGAVDTDESELAETFELPGADLSNEELSVRVLPRQADEFTCSRCFLVHHRSQLAGERNGQQICMDCAA